MSTCKDCIHNKICGHYVKSLSKSNGIDFDNAIEQYCEISECDNCEYFQNRSKFIELPCKVGDTVYRIIRNDITEWRVNAINYRISECSYEINGCFLINLTHKKTGYHNSYYFHEEDIYFSKKEAEKALKKRNDEERKNVVVKMLSAKDC